MGLVPAALPGRLGLLVRGHPEVSLSCRAGGRAISEGWIPWPQFTGPFVGVTETVCGSWLIIGLFSSLAFWPLLIDILVAIAVEVGTENGPPKRGPVTTALSKTLLEQSW
jgi:uncharacterized membrane protein YphA (DoxX/SURF4 family)